MSDIYRKPTQGEPFQPSAKQFGAFIDAAMAHQSREAFGDAAHKTEQTRGLVFVKNGTGGVLNLARPVLGLDAIAITPADRTSAIFERPVFNGVAPVEADHLGKFAVLIKPAKSNEVVPAVISGQVWVRMLVDDVEHEFADVEAGQTGRLKTADTGAAHILWLGPDEEGETDVRWALVRLSNTGGCGARNEKWKFQITGTPTGGSFTFNLNVLGVTDTITINFDDTDAEIETAFEAHTNIATGDVEVIGGPLPGTDFTIEFKGNLEKTEFPAPTTINKSGLTGGTGTGVFWNTAQRGMPRDGSVAP